MGSPAGDAQSWLGAVQPNRAGAAPGRSRDASQCLPVPPSLTQACTSSIPTRTPAKARNCPTSSSKCFPRHTKPLACVNLKLASPRQVMRAPLSSCQVQEKETERKCFQGQECPWGWEETMPGRETLMLTWNGTRSWSSWPPGLPGATGQCFPKTALWLRTPQNVPFSHWPLGMQAPVSSHCLPPNSSASHGPSHQCCSHSSPGKAPEQGTGRAGGSEGDLVT